jgi:hypothetical protein
MSSAMFLTCFLGNVSLFIAVANFLKPLVEKGVKNCTRYELILFMVSGCLLTFFWGLTIGIICWK